MYKNPAQNGSGRSRKKVYIKTFGCQMNVYDSERMTDVLAPVGYDQTNNVEDADLIVLNTCHIREKAAEKVYSELGRIKRIKLERSRSGKDTLIAVAGCVAQAEGKEIVNRAPVVDLVVGPQSYHRLPDLIFRARQEERQIVYAEFPEEEKFGHMPISGKRRAPAAFLTVQEGCDKFCTFCVVPYTRGVEYSRKVEEIQAEARKLTESGVKEITLLGQNVNAYHGQSADGKEYTLAGLIARLAGIDGLERLRYTTSHPKDMTAELIDAHRDIPELMPYLHLPFQAGSDRILAAMNRKHTREDYLRIIERLRAARPDIALSTDIIVGFPGESDREFEQTLSLVRQVEFSHAFSFKYSPRPGTPAASMEQLPEAAKSERLQVLQELITSQQTRFNESCVGTSLPVLFEKPGRNPGQLVGRSPYLQAVHVDSGEIFMGEIREVEIQESTTNSLKGVIKSANKSDISAAIGGSAC